MHPPKQALHAVPRMLVLALPPYLYLKPYKIYVMSLHLINSRISSVPTPQISGTIASLPWSFEYGGLLSRLDSRKPVTPTY